MSNRVQTIQRARAVDSDLLRIAEIRDKAGYRAAYEAARAIADTMYPPHRRRWRHTTALAILAAAKAVAAGDTCGWKTNVCSPTRQKVFVGRSSLYDRRALCLIAANPYLGVRRPLP